MFQDGPISTTPFASLGDSLSGQRQDVLHHQVLDLVGGTAVFYPQPPLPYHPDILFDVLVREVPWEQKTLNFGHGPVLQPRLIAWYSQYSYTYSRMRLEPKPMDRLLWELSHAMSEITQTLFNGVLLNYYQDGNTSIGMHADDEPEFGHNPVIASLSLGYPRRFDFKRKDKTLSRQSIELTHGSVLVMAGETQTNWDHGIAKTKQPVGPRINLTFRNIVNPR